MLAFHIYSIVTRSVNRQAMAGIGCVRGKKQSSQQNFLRHQQKLRLTNCEDYICNMLHGDIMSTRDVSQAHMAHHLEFLVFV